MRDFRLVHIDIRCLERIPVLMAAAMEPLSAKADVEQGFIMVKYVKPIVLAQADVGRQFLAGGYGFHAGMPFIHDGRVVEHAQRTVIIVSEF
jgi:hypothetical protein